jgi:hypothetical protein
MGNKRSTLVEEMVNADFGDVRLSQRLARIVAVIEGAPQASFPTVFDDAELEGAYRFWSNERVDSDAILEPHLASTGERAATEKRVRVLHDTTALNYGESEREGLGRLREKAQGMFLHASLVVSADEARRPLGLVGARCDSCVLRAVGLRASSRTRHVAPMVQGRRRLVHGRPSMLLRGVLHLRSRPGLFGRGSHVHQRLRPPDRRAVRRHHRREDGVRVADVQSPRLLWSVLHLGR